MLYASSAARTPRGSVPLMAVELSGTVAGIVLLVAVIHAHDSQVPKQHVFVSVICNSACMYVIPATVGHSHTPCSMFHEPVPPTAYRTVGLLAAPMRLVSAISAAAMKGLSTLRRTITWTGWHSRVT